jgi:hypothetical protein
LTCRNKGRDMPWHVPTILLTCQVSPPVGR